MGLLRAVVTISEYASVVINYQCNLGFLKYFLKVFFSHLFLFCKLPHLEKQNPDSHFEEEAEYHPSPSALVSLIPVPVSVESITAAAIKEKLSVAVYNRVAERSKNENYDDGGGGDPPACAVCLEKLEAIHEVRELHNCRHLYHRQCLDAWVERGHVTCPICRARLLAADPMSHKEGEGEEPRDPWRSERMMYLFGEDVYFEPA